MTNENIMTTEELIKGIDNVIDLRENINKQIELRIQHIYTSIKEWVKTKVEVDENALERKLILVVDQTEIGIHFMDDSLDRIHHFATIDILDAKVNLLILDLTYQEQYLQVCHMKMYGLEDSIKYVDKFIKRRKFIPKLHIPFISKSFKSKLEELADYQDNLKGALSLGEEILEYAENYDNIIKGITFELTDWLNNNLLLESDTPFSREFISISMDDILESEAIEFDDIESLQEMIEQTRG